jgi:translation initiation factor IF-2
MSKETKTVPRAPIVTVVGHVDHGKSSLLDYIRKSNTTDNEAGGITQHVSAYEVEHDGKNITFLDTPGHAAFSAIRSRSVAIADVAILVIAADYGVKPQTIEALKAIEEAKIPFIVALNKIDKPGVNIETTKQNLAEHNIFVEGYGGHVSYTAISALKGDGIEELLDLIILTAEVEELTYSPNTPAQGYVLEASVDAKRGVSATLILQDGDLEKGSVVVSGASFSPLRSLQNFRGDNVDSVHASQPVSITGWNNVPPVGDTFSIVKNKKEAESLIAQTIEEKSTAEQVRLTGDQVLLPLIIQADTTGSLEALIKELNLLETGDNLIIKVIKAGVGAVTESDIRLAQGDSKALVISFSSKIDTQAKRLAEQLEIEITHFDIIYKLLEWLEEKIENRKPVTETEEIRGALKVLKTFSQSKGNQIIGGRVESGSIKTGDAVRVIRQGSSIATGVIKELRQQKSITDEVKEGNECGLLVQSKIEVSSKDTLEAHFITRGK